MSTVITLSEPVKLNDSYGSYISYRVSTSTTKSIFTSPNFYVTRRFSDFVWLSKELSRLFPGIIVPSLPEKQTVGRFSNEFVESRLRGLERFIQRVAANNEMGNSKAIIIFLEADDATLNSAMNETKASKPNIRFSAMNMFQGTINTIQNSGKAEIETTAADLKIADLVTYVNALEKQLQNITKYVDNWIRKCEENATTMAELGQCMNTLGVSETTLIGDTISELGKTTERVGVDGTYHAEKQILQLEEPLQEYLRTIACVRYAIQQRQEKKQAYIDALTEVEVRQSQYNKLLGAAGKEDQASQKQQLVVKAQELADAAKIEHEQVTERLLRESESFKFQKAQDFRSILMKFVDLQIEFQRKAVENWESVLPKLQGGIEDDTKSNLDRYEEEVFLSSPPPLPNSPPPRNPFSNDVNEYVSFEPEDDISTI